MEPVEGLGVHRTLALDASHERTVVGASNVRHTHSHLHHREAVVPSKLLLLVPPVTSSRNVLFRSTVKVQEIGGESAAPERMVTISDRSRFLDAKKSWTPRQSLRDCEVEM
jgi:hypothetical protein